MGPPLLGDKPINSASEDLLGRSEFARAVAETIAKWRGNESLTVAISGDWGSGKTSLKNMVIEHLRSVGGLAPLIIEFNPWNWSAQEKVAEAFFHEIAVALGKADPSSEGRKRVRRWKRYGRLLRFGSETAEGLQKLIVPLAAIAIVPGLIAALLPSRWTTWLNGTVSISLGFIAAFLLFGSDRATRFANLIEAKITDEETKSVEERKEELRHDIGRLPRTILVVIDDIDRVSRDETRVLFQHLKANADFPKLVYLLLYAEDRVARHLSEEGEDGRDFLAKIVQLPLNLPIISQASVDRFLFHGVDSILETLGDIKWDNTRWGNAYYGALQCFFPNFRAVSRYLTTLQVHAGLFSGAAGFEVNAVDFLGLEAIRLFARPSYTRLAESKHELVGYRIDHNTESREQLRKKVEAISALAGPNARAVQELMGQIFPAVGWALGGIRYDRNEWGATWRRERRACSEELFDRFFRLGIPEYDLSEAELQEIVDLSSDQPGLIFKLTALSERHLLPLALRRILERIADVPWVSASSFLAALMDAGEMIVDQGGLDTVPPSWLIISDLRALLSRTEDRAERTRLFEAATRLSTGVYICGSMLRTEIVPDPSGLPPLLDAGKERLRALWLERIEGRAKSEPERLLTHPNVVQLLYLWKDLRSVDAVRSWLADITTSEDALLDFLAATVWASATHTMGDHVSRPREVVALDPFRDFLDFAEVTARIERTDVRRLDPRRRRAVEIFHDTLKMPAFLGGGAADSNS